MISDRLNKAVIVVRCTRCGVVIAGAAVKYGEFGDYFAAYSKRHDREMDIVEGPLSFGADCKCGNLFDKEKSE